MVRKADAGDIVGQRVVPIEPEDTAVILYGKLCQAAEGLLDELLPLMKEGKAPHTPQDITQGSYYGGRRPEDGRIDWLWPQDRIYNLIRAVTEPYPGAFCILPDSSKLLIWWAIRSDEGAGGRGGRPGRILIDGKQVLIQTGQGKIQLLDVQTEDRRMTGDELAEYFKDREGMLLS